MIVDITERNISIKKIDSAISQFESENGYKEAYLFMNSETAADLTAHHDFKKIKTCDFNYSTSIFDYSGCKVYLDDSLKYGELMLR